MMPVISDDTNDTESNDFEERATLTQRRQMSGASKLNRSKLEKLQSIHSKVDEEPKDGSTGKVVIWVVAVITLAAAAYFGIKSFLNKPTTNSTTPTPTVTVEPTQDVTSLIMTGSVQLDSAAANKAAASAFTITNQQVGKSSTAEYTLKSVEVDRYTTFTRFIFNISGALTTPVGTLEPFPVTSATYNATNQQITLVFNQITSNQSAFSQGGVANINTTNVATLTHNLSVADNQEEYVIDLNSTVGYVLQTVIADNNIIVDVRDSNTVRPTTSVTPSAGATVGTTVTATPTVSVTPVVTTPVVLVTPVTGSTSFSTGAQQISSGLTTNTFGFVNPYVNKDGKSVGFTYGDNCSACLETVDSYAGIFTYQKKLGNSTIPNVTANLSDTTLTIAISNYAIANSASQRVPTTGSMGSTVVDHLDASVTNHVLTYVFTLKKSSQYRIVFDTTNLVLNIQVKM